MPKTVDHEQRRTSICRAVTRIAAEHGLHNVTMRKVASEADMSLRLVQYYFDTKANLMSETLRYLERESWQRWRSRLEQQLDRSVDPRDVLDAYLDEALPSDDRSRTHHLLWNSYAVLALTDPDLSGEPFVEGPRRLEEHLADVLRTAVDRGALASDRDPRYEAARLVALGHGLGSSVVTGHKSVAAARAVAARHLDALFGPSASAG